MSVEPVVYVVDADPSICQSLHKQIRAWGWNCQMFSSA